jgi:ryanodine receptor 2
LLAEALRQKYAAFRTYRAEKNYAVQSGKWYFEFEVMTAGPMRVGWARADCNPGTMLGNDDGSWAFDGYNVRDTIFFISSILRVPFGKFVPAKIESRYF